MQFICNVLQELKSFVYIISVLRRTIKFIECKKQNILVRLRLVILVKDLKPYYLIDR